MLSIEEMLNNGDYKKKLNLVFHKMFVEENGCWVWTGANHRGGYGYMNFRKKNELVHRIAWIVFKGEIPSGLKVCHICDNRACCNPDHLFVGTQKDNMKDCSKKKRLRKGLGDNLRKLSQFQVDEIRHSRKNGTKIKDLCDKYGVKRECIRLILIEKTWKTKVQA